MIIIPYFIKTIIKEIKKEGKNQLEENTIKLLTHNDSAVGTTVNAFEEDVRLMLCQQSSMDYKSTPFMVW
ncbi:MAG: hypothetical protein R6U96_05855 [Promethearchaeia archaeon]